jgi:uncharacterized protein with ATP-grasp and redox domains
LKQALSAARRAGADEATQSVVIHEVLKLLHDIRLDATPPEIAFHVHRIVRDMNSARDPYQNVKTRSTADALDIYPRLKQLVAESEDELDTAIRISIAGNIIDFGVTEEVQDLWQVVESILRQPYAIDDTAQLRAKLDDAAKVLFLADNAGETVFDRVLIETLSVPVIYAVRGGPILNDATMEDAIAAGLDQCATLISNGSDAPGTILSQCSDEFRRLYESAPLIIAKGQGNYETLSEAGSRVFCLLRVKCPVIAQDIGQPVDSIVVRQSR